MSRPSSPISTDPQRGRGVTAVLGPTNTGKTHLAIERMLAHDVGIIGLPCACFAREVYDKIVARVGASQVALITGEEKIKPPSPRFYVCTVEAMPLELEADFVAVDEIQLAADGERGHVFTDRLFHARGVSETLLLGAATMRDAIRELLPGANLVSRPRLSQLTYAGDKKITRLPRRSAIVGFSANDVYAIAELVRRQRGGAAVVLGALSPAHAQCASRALSERRCRFPGGDRRHRHGPQSRSRPCRLRRHPQIRRAKPPQSDAGRAWPDRRPRRTSHE